MSATASPYSCPPNQISSTAATSSRHGISTGEPELTTTTVRGFTAATARTRSSCLPGSVSEVLSYPSDSTLEFVPTTTTATSAARAAPEDVPLELQLDRFALDDLHRHRTGRRREEGRSEIGTLRLHGVLVQQLVVQVNPAGADAGEPEQDLPGDLRLIVRGELEQAGRGDRGVAAEPHQRGSPAVLPEQLGTLRVQETHQATGFPGG